MCLLHVNHPVVSEPEQKTDIHVSSLRSCIEAMGGKLQIVAEFPEGDVAIANFSPVDGEQDPL